MKQLGLAIDVDVTQMSPNDPDTRYEGVWMWCSATYPDVIINKTGIIRKNSYEAHRDALKQAKTFATDNNIVFWTDGGVL